MESAGRQWGAMFSFVQMEVRARVGGWVDGWMDGWMDGWISRLPIGEKACWRRTPGVSSITIQGWWGCMRVRHSVFQELPPWGSEPAEEARGDSLPPASVP